MALIDVKVPEIGDFTDVTVIEILVQEGDTVETEQSLITLESDKASIEIPSSAAGVVKKISVKLGDKINEGSIILQLESTQDGNEAAQAKDYASAVQSNDEQNTKDDLKEDSSKGLSSASVGNKEAKAAPVEAHQPDRTAAKSDQLPHASPSIRKLARELGVPLEQVKGSGRNGRIGLEDLQNFVKAVMVREVSAKQQQPTGSSTGAGLDLLPWPKVDFEKFGEVEYKDLSRIKKISGANLLRNWVMIPHVTNNDEADITELEALRVKLNAENSKAKVDVKFTMLTFLIKAVVAALKKFPDFNASLSGEQLVYKKYFHIGFAADTPNGLMVPVVRDADKKSLSEIAQDMAALSAKARSGKLSPSEMTGGCFSISSLGGIGGTHFTPIVNAPEVAILGVSRSAMKPVWDGKEFQPRLMCPLSLSYDHRVIDGAAAARFNAYLTQLLTDFRRVML